MHLSAGENKNDRLTAYDGTSITYDDIGNPITIGDMSLTWEGRQLKEFSVPAMYSCQYTYNADGIRTSKTIDGAVHSYVLDGSRIVSETIGSGHIFIYLYDETGSPIGIKYRRSNYAAEVYDYFFFEKNLQGDIVAIYNESGAKVATYTYDAWGKVTVTYVTTNAVERYISTNNPFRYRGYYYDIETGWYYLQSRYYNPTWGRFLNADGVANLGANQDLQSYNLYAYCSNNPIMGYDPTGEWTFSISIGVSFFVFGFGFSGTIDFTFSEDSMAIQATECDSFNDNETFNDQLGVNAGLTYGVQQTELNTCSELVDKTIVSSGGDAFIGVDILNDYDTAEYVGWRYGGTVGCAFDGHKTVSKTYTILEIPTLNLPKRLKEWLGW